jgi:hypothetical protein
MAHDNWDAILTSTPLNSTAGAVTSRGEHYEPILKEAPHILHRDAPPKMRAVPRSAPNLIGQTFGRMTVVGVYDDCEGAPRKDKKTKWVTRCACGNYEVRSSKAIRNPQNSEDRCIKCRDWSYKQRRYERLGPRAVEDFTA